MNFHLKFTNGIHNLMKLRRPGGALKTRQARQGWIAGGTTRVGTRPSSTCHFRRSQGGGHLLRRVVNSCWRLLRGKITTTSPRTGTDWTPTSGSTVLHFRFGGYGVGRGGTTGDGRFGNGTGIPLIARRPKWPGHGRPVDDDWPMKPS